MKTVFKVLAIAAVLALVLATVNAVVVAQDQDETGLGRGRMGAVEGTRDGVDANEDGLCDICGEEMGEGRHGPRGGMRGFQGAMGADEDGDGVCDICGESCDGEYEGEGPRWGTRSEQGGGFGRGRGLGRGDGAQNPQDLSNPS